jgi:CBS domain-containing protein
LSGRSLAGVRQRREFYSAIEKNSKILAFKLFPCFYLLTNPFSRAAFVQSVPPFPYMIDLEQQLNQPLIMPKTVADVMSREPILARPEMPLNEAIKILAERRISGLPVVDENDLLVGVISETDLMWRETGVTPPAYIMVLDSVIYLENPSRYERELHKALGQTVGEAMSKEPVTIGPDKSVQEAAKLMHDRSIHRLPVVDTAGKVIGILTRGDIIRWMAAES